MADITSTIEQRIQKIVDGIDDFQKFLQQYENNECFRIWVNNTYNEIVLGWNVNDSVKGFFDINNTTAKKRVRATWVHAKQLDEAKIQLQNCLRKSEAREIVEETPQNPDEGGPGFDGQLGSIFDNRLQRLVSGSNDIVITPYDTRFQDAGTTGFIVNEKTIKEANPENLDEYIEGQKRVQQQMAKDPYYRGVASVINAYSLVKLYGSQGGQDLVDRKDQRRWYEVNTTQESLQAYSLNPTTTSIINWGEKDPFGRTPYHYSDFVFCKYWNLVPNNRMITLRRYAAPIVDNLKFPGMYGFTDDGTASTKSNDNQGGAQDLAKAATEDAKSTGSGDGEESQGSGRKVDFPPMATAVTFFGEETNNSLSDILKFTTGVNWEDQEDAKVFETDTTSVPDVEAGPAGIYGGLARTAKMLNIATGNFDTNAILNKGALPPDPYKDGPYENRIIGPVNAITSVKKRARGIKYENNISLVFEYVARPIGGVNTKAVLLDIISNFLVIGSATAMFWGGQHRFMGRPQQYPFIGGDKGIQQWYRGNPVGWGETAIDSFTNKIIGGGGLLDMAKNFFGDLLGGGSGGGRPNLKDILTGDNIAGNIVKAQAAARSEGTIPYLTGLKALLIGEPVGEWHITIGNPLNPIAMIGNLICDSLEVEFGEELGPDDFPLEVKITANLQHGMARDRDAIQSMFNRGMGRIYDLPDGFTSSADYETKVDNFTGNADSRQGRSPNDWRLGAVLAGGATTGGKTGKSQTVENKMQGETSIWNKATFDSGATPNATDTPFFNNRLAETRSEFRSATWVSLKSTS